VDRDPYVHPLLGVLPRERRGALGFGLVSLNEDACVCEAGEELDRVFFILGGSARLVHRDASSGVRMVMDTASAGDAVGLELGDGPGISRFDVLADAGFGAVVLPMDDVRGLLNECPEFTRAVLALVEKKRSMFLDRLLAAKELDVSRVVFDPALVERFPPQYLLNKRVLPLAFQAGLATIAAASQDLGGIEADMQRYLTAQRVMAYRISPKQFDRVYMEQVQKKGGPGRMDDQVAWYRHVKAKEYTLAFEVTSETKPDTDSKSDLDGAVIVGMFNKIVGEALDLGASDIHLEPNPGGLDVRYRLDGELLLRPERVQSAYAPAVVSRGKVLAGMDISERRRPQDGRMTVTYGRRVVDMRVSCVPTRFGEKMVLRILDPTTMLIELDQLVASRKVRDSVKGMLEQPCGVVLVAGPTGSGKTTTVYSLLMAKKNEYVNIMTIEDPIEYVLRGITQVQRNPHVGLDCPHAIRAFPRKDPDVIIVGETRDPETAKAALEAGLTGHLVISTVHANNVFATAYRLKEMGTEPFIIANSLIGVLSQRLLRRVCPNCAQTVQYHRRLIDPMELPGIPEPLGDFYLFSKGKGCIHCNHRGYRGRVAAYEVLRITDELKPLIASDVAFAELQRHAVRLGCYVSMREYAGILLNSATTTPEEVSRILFVENR